MDADTSEKIRDVISFVHSRTLSIGVYSPGDISVTNMYEEAASDITEIIQQEIAKARIDELDRLIDIESKTFNRWSQKDIANFFNVVGKRYRELETLKEHKEE